METKICKRCGIEKPLNDYYKTGKYYRKFCKLCYYENKKEYHKNNREKRQYLSRKWRENNPEKVKESSKIYEQKNKEKRNKSANNYQQIHKEELKIKKKEYFQNHKEQRNKYARTRYLNELQYKLNCVIRGDIAHSLKNKNGSKNGRHWVNLVGYTLNDLKLHLEKQFIEGMNWNNYGIYGWHIDHIIPISAFNFDCPENPDFKRCWALSNLQPMWSKDNWGKHDKLERPFQPSLALKL